MTDVISENTINEKIAEENEEEKQDVGSEKTDNEGSETQEDGDRFPSEELSEDAEALKQELAQIRVEPPTMPKYACQLFSDISRR